MPFAHWIAAVIATWTRHLNRARQEAETALALSPNYAPAYGTGSAPLPRFMPAIRWWRSPISIAPCVSTPPSAQQYMHFLGSAYLVAAKYETAATLLKQRIAFVPGTDFSRALLTSALGHLGERRGSAARVGRAQNRSIRITRFREHFGRLPYKNQADVERIADGLLKAGIDLAPTESTAPAGTATH